MEYLVNIITKHFVKKKVICKDNEKIYAYGFKLIFSDILNFCIIMLIASIVQLPISGAVFLITLCCIRKHSGGFHAKSFFWCRTAMIITFCTVIATSVIIEKFNYSMVIVSTINITSFIIISILSPIEHYKKKLTETQKKKNKVKAIVFTGLGIIISTVLYYNGYIEGIVISVTLAAIVVLMIIGLFKMKGGVKNV